MLCYLINLCSFTWHWTDCKTLVLSFSYVWALRFHSIWNKPSEQMSLSRQQSHLAWRHSHSFTAHSLTHCKLTFHKISNSLYGLLCTVPIDELSGLSWESSHWLGHKWCSKYKCQCKHSSMPKKLPSLFLLNQLNADIEATCFWAGMKFHFNHYCDALPYPE